MDRPLRQQGAQTYPEVQILQEQGQMVHGLTHEGAQGLVDAARGRMRQTEHTARALVDLYRQADDGLEIIETEWIGLSVFPSPATNELTIQFENINTPLLTIYNINVICL